MPIAPVHNTTVDLSAQSADSVDTETRERPALLYPGFPVVSLSDFLREIPDRWLIWYARAKDER